MMKDIQEKRIESEISQMKSCEYSNKIKKVNKDEYYFDIIFPLKAFESPHLHTDINIFIHMLPNFPFTQPKVYCKTHFCFPHISDGRDILEDVIGQPWATNLKIIDVINKIPHFITEFVKNLNEGVLVLIGNYYLGEKYDMSLFESLPVYRAKVKEKIIIDNKEKEYPRLLILSDIFFLLFELEKWNKNNLKLIFWTNIRSLVTIKKMIKGYTCRFFWKQRNKKKNYEMLLNLDNSNELVHLMLEKMSKFGMNYKVSKNVPRSGTLPPIDIETVEKSIEEIEAKAEEKPDLELMQYLMSLYENAVEYYSATNNPKYEYYTQKIRETLKSPRINVFLESQNSENSYKIEKSEKKEEFGENSEKLENKTLPTATTITNQLENKIDFDKTLKNEEKGIKMEITYDEKTQHYDYSDEEEEDEIDEHDEH